MAQRQEKGRRRETRTSSDLGVGGFVSGGGQTRVGRRRRGGPSLEFAHSPTDRAARWMDGGLVLVTILVAILVSILVFLAILVWP